MNLSLSIAVSVCDMFVFNGPKPYQNSPLAALCDLPAFFGPLASRVWSVVMPFSAKC